MADTANHYQTLGLERTAEPREIKRAYFALVRKFPPESHPEDFKRVRAAYETLSDPAAKARYDTSETGYSEYGEAAAVLLTKAEELFRTGDEVGARTWLEQLLEQQPGLLLAREWLALSFLRSDDAKSASHHYKQLVVDQPGRASHHLYLGQALRRLGQDDDALATLQRARDLDPDNVDGWLALANFRNARGEHDKALAELEAALVRHPTQSEARLALDLCRLTSLFLRDSLVAADGGVDARRELDAFVEGSRRVGDPEYQRFVASSLSSVAALLLARERQPAANTVLARCPLLNPAARVERAWPLEIQVTPDELPPAARDWLLSQQPGDESPAIAGSRLVPEASILMVALILATATLWALLGFDGSASPPWVIAGLLLVPASVAAVWKALADVIAAHRNPLPALTAIHPFYLVRSEGTRVKLWPILRLSRVDLTRHSTNGVYTTTTIAATFAATKVTVSVRDEDYAGAWAQHLLDTRAQLLSMMSDGVLEAAPGADFLPLELVDQPPRSRWRRLVPPSRTLFKLAAASLAVLTVLGAQRVRTAADAELGAVLDAGSVENLRSYLESHSAGPRARIARSELARHYALARSEYLAVARPEATGRAAVEAALDRLASSGETRVALRLDVAPLVPAATDDDAVGRCALDATTAQAALLARLQNVLQRVGLGDVVRLEAAGTPTAPNLTIAANASQRQVAPLAALQLGRVPGLAVDWALELRSSGEPAPLYTTELSGAAPDRLRIPAGHDWRGRACDAQRAAALDALLSRVATDWGIESAAERERSAGLAAVRSDAPNPYAASTSRPEARP